MLNPKEFYDYMINDLGLEQFYGVPDSTLKDLCSYIDENSRNHLICANEGSAIGHGIGYHLATGKTPVIYMQNSGFGNSLNPILSMASKEIYKIPMIILVGWRGEPGVSDEPQHIHQGKVLIPSLGSMELGFELLPTKIEGAKRILKDISSKLENDPQPYFVIIKKGTFTEYKSNDEKSETALNRIDVIKALIDNFQSSKFISSTGFISREIYQIRNNLSQAHHTDFLTIGAMGHTSQIAYSFAQNSKKHTICLDGDGSFIMHMGGVTSILHFEQTPLLHVVLNNGCHLSVGGQPSVGHKIDIASIAKASGFKHAYTIKSMKELNETLPKLKNASEPVLLNVIVAREGFDKLVRPEESPDHLKNLFMEK